ncbi:MAG TPA: chromosome segregation protein SMC [Candidatus Limnocylindria bacterium]|nr:chromosome segregation protein SMC [Candidatus Limnocylindria bacterium]
MTKPARLLTVRLQGFKSFADRTHVEFGPGISAVVGPNGSGKSNLADALRWALGEQGRALRSRKSEDVIWAGSEKRPAVGMADVQLTLDNGDGLLPVDYGVVELGRRLYRSGENDYLLNRQRVRLKDLVDLLDAGHIAENAFLFIGQGMVDQALALRPEERRPLFEEVAGVRRHERRRRRAEEQLVESEANLARVDDILAELRPQARRLGQQAEQQASRRSAADELASAILLSAHGRWHDAATRAASSAAAVTTARAGLDAANAELLEHERAMTEAGAALGGQATAEAEARSVLDRTRAERATLQLREGRNGSDLEAAARERTRHAEGRAAADAELAAARAILAEPTPPAPAPLEEELAGVEADLAAAVSGAAAEPDPKLQAADAAAIRRLEAARAEEGAAARRRAADAERIATDETLRAAAASERRAASETERAAAVAAMERAMAAEVEARAARETAQQALTTAEAAARVAADRAGGARATLSAIAARLADARRAHDAAEGSGFSRAARARGGRSIGDGLIVEPSLKAAVDAALAGLGRALVLPRGEIAALTSERGVAIPVEALAAKPAAGRQDPGSRLVEVARSRGGGPLTEAIRRDDAGAATAFLARAVWLPESSDCLELQAELPVGWVAVARNGSLVVGDLAAWVQPDGRGLHLRADLDRLAEEHAGAEVTAATAAAEVATAESAASQGRAALSAARNREAAASVARRRAEEVERAATARAETAARDAAWLSAQAERLVSEAARLRAVAPDDQPDPEAPEATASAASTAAARADEDAARRLVRLRERRDALAREIAAARARRAEQDRRRAQAEAGIALAERQLAQAASAAADLAEREARLVTERDELAGILADVGHAVAAAEATLAAILAAAGTERERLRAAEAQATAGRERARIAGERARLAERDEVEARIAIEGLHEQLLVELAGLGAIGLVHLQGAGAGPIETDPSQRDADVDPEALASALRLATVAWAAAPPPTDPPAPTRLATLRRRFHELGAVNPFAAEEFAEVKARLDGLEAQRSDIQSAIERTRDLISELDKLVSDQFRRTFEALERAFDARFQQLFGGGYARLLLTDPTDLAATGIEITARPPGKKAQALSMLSGGERALTAVALLFAMLEVRPVPFCVLDEVDAALDEANIGRFTDALRDLSHQTQCIVITHNRGTIEAADALYGVTVGDDSVSRVISLRLDEATAMARRGGGSGSRASEPPGPRADPDMSVLAAGEA